MKLRLTLLSTVLFFPIIVSIIYSCNPCGKGVHPDVNNCVSVDSIAVFNIDRATQQTIASGDTIAASSFALMLTILYDVKTCMMDKYINPFISSAYACDIAFTINNNIEDSIIALRIKSDADFDPNHLAGASLNDIFNVPETQAMNYGMYAGSIQMNLLTKPNTNRLHKLSVDMIYSSGAIQTITAEPVVLTK